MKKFFSFALFTLALSTAALASGPGEEPAGNDPVVINGLKSRVGIAIQFTNDFSNPAYIKIYDRSDKSVVFSETYKSNGEHSRGYDLSALPAGEYLVYVTVGDKLVKKEMSISSEKGTKSYSFIYR
ncbi:MAG: hypothetical protein INR69_07585 [Mucilaginibacter polytrichastri]|nr:hypothetical protein [Mucilaginibacter polytrichastri]